MEVHRWACLVGVTLFLFPIVLGQGGMVPVSPVIDHDVSKKSPPPPSAQDGKAGPLSPQKIKNHMKIAEESLDNTQSDGDRVKVAEKPETLQDPSRHSATDPFLLSFLLAQYPLSQNVEEQAEILENLENFSHKFENGRDLFKTPDVLEKVILPALNSSHSSLRLGACGVVAVAAQNNAEVQDIAVDGGVVRVLVGLLTFDTERREVKARALFALTSLLRNFPKGQGKFVKQGGVPAVVKTALQAETRRRSVNLLTDLLMERNFCRIEQLKHGRVESSAADGEVEEDDHDPCDDFRTLEKALKDSGWCNLLVESVGGLSGLEMEDVIVTNNAVGASMEFCKEQLRPRLEMLQNLLRKMKEDSEMSQEDWSSEIETLEDIVNGLTSVPPKDEL